MISPTTHDTKTLLTNLNIKSVLIVIVLKENKVRLVSQQNTSAYTIQGPFSWWLSLSSPPKKIILLIQGPFFMVVAVVCLCRLKGFLFMVMKIIKRTSVLLVISSFTLYHPILQPSVRTRRSNGSVDDTTFGGALKCFSDITGTRSAIKKIGTEVIQLLLVHGFQVIVLVYAISVYVSISNCPYKFVLSYVKRSLYSSMQ